jgi:hypothetical protein
LTIRTKINLMGRGVVDLKTSCSMTNIQSRRVVGTGTTSFTVMAATVMTLAGGGRGGGRLPHWTDLVR